MFYSWNPFLNVLILLATLFLIGVIAYVIFTLQRRVRRIERHLHLCPKRGKPGKQGPPGCPGKDGTDGTALDWAEFYAKQDAPPFDNDNPNPIPQGEAIRFPNAGVSKGTGKIFIDAGVSPVGTAIRLTDPGTYQIDYAIVLADAGQLVIALDDGSGFVEQDADYIGIASAGLLSEQVLITTVDPDINLFIVNPANQSTSITLAAGAGSTGNATTNARVVITRIK